MKSKSTTWFETKIKYDKTQDDGLVKTVREAYTVEALSFTEAEAAITKEASAYISGEFSVVEEKVAVYKEVLFSDDPRDDKWYKVKIALITLDEKTGKEKRTTIYYLVQASSVDSARRNMTDFFIGSTLDNEIVSVSLTSIIDVYEHKAN